MQVSQYADECAGSGLWDNADAEGQRHVEGVHRAVGLYGTAGGDVIAEAGFEVGVYMWQQLILNTHSGSHRPLPGCFYGCMCAWEH